MQKISVENLGTKVVGTKITGNKFSKDNIFRTKVPGPKFLATKCPVGNRRPKGQIHIYGYKDRQKAGVTTHRERRIEIYDKLAQKTAGNPMFGHWFPLREGRSGRHSEL